MNRIQQAIAKAREAQQCLAGISVKYFTDSTHWFRLTAVPGQTTFLVDDGNGVAVDYTSRDYIVSASDLTLNGVPVVPADGHKIKEEVGNVVHTYAVRREDGGQPWRYSDHGRSTVRIHTKLDQKVNK